MRTTAGRGSAGCCWRSASGPDAGRAAVSAGGTGVGDTAAMPPVVLPPPAAVRPLTIAISSRALFDLEDSHGLFEREGIAAYQAFQREREDEVLAPGIAFPLVRKLLALNALAPLAAVAASGGGAVAGGEVAPRVEVILLSRNSSDTGLRIFNSIQHH